MQRRSALVLAGSTLSIGLTGCLGNTFSSSNGHLDVNGVEVPLVSTSTAEEWYYENNETLFLDTRTQREFEELRISGAAFSPADDGLPDDDPTEGLDSDTRMVTYCRCPHTLAGRRAASIISAGFSEVHALDEGFDEWIDRDLPLEGAGLFEGVRSEDLDEPAYHQ